MWSWPRVPQLEHSIHLLSIKAVSRAHHSLFIIIFNSFLKRFRGIPTKKIVFVRTLYISMKLCKQKHVNEISPDSITNHLYIIACGSSHH